MRLAAIVLLLAAPLLAEVETIYVVPGSHLDVGFTDTPSAVRDKRVRTLDDAIDAAEADPDFRWNEEGAWVFDQWLEAHKGDEARLATMKRLLGEGRFYVGATYVNPHAAIFPESLDLLTVHLDRLEKDFGVRPHTAIVNDVPSVPEAIVDALSARGVKYLLVGANMTFTPPLPKELVRSPFWWESASGKRLLVYIDPDSYTAAYTKWGIDPDCARFFNEKEFPRDKGPMETMEAGVRRMLAQTDASVDAVVIEHAFDNWDDGGAKKLPGFVRQWNEAKKKPRIVVATAEEYFRHVEETCGARLPVRHGEWGGDWDAGRAACPVWTWRLRKATHALGADASYEARSALAVTMDHGMTLGGGWPGMFTEEQTRAHAKECAAMFESAVRLGIGSDATATAPAEMVPPAGRVLPEAWKGIIADADHPARVRGGPFWLGPFVDAKAPSLDILLEWGADGNRLVISAGIDRAKLATSVEPGLAVVLEVALKGDARALRLAPAGSPSAIAGRWLRGEPPPFVVAPGELVVLGLAKRLRVRSSLLFSYAIVPDPADPGRSWLQALVLRQSTLAKLKGGATRVFPFEELYPGEPASLTADLELEIVE